MSGPVRTGSLTPTVLAMLDEASMQAIRAEVATEAARTHTGSTLLSKAAEHLRQARTFLAAYRDSVEAPPLPADTVRVPE